ncbi:MAG: YciI family protein [Myxococcales bacterium]
MFVIELIYKAELTQIDAAMKEHMAFLKRGYAAGVFVLSGRKIPRDGGILLAVGNDREKVEQLMALDPFVAKGLADVHIIQFRASQRAENVDEVLKQEP